VSLESTLESVLIEKLRKTYESERELSKLLPKLIKSAKSHEVKSVLQQRLDEASEPLVRLEVAFDTLDRGMASARKHHGVKPSERAQTLADDAAVMAEALRAQHHHIADYRTLACWAMALGHEHVSRLLLMTLEQEVASESAIDDLSEAGLKELEQAGGATHRDAPEPVPPGWLTRTSTEKRLIPKDFMLVAAK